MKELACVSMKPVAYEQVSGYDFEFNNGVSVRIFDIDEVWEYQEGDDSDSYLSGIYILDGDTVIDYDGCFDLPDEVKIALGRLYKLDL